MLGWNHADVTKAALFTAMNVRVIILVPKGLQARTEDALEVDVESDDQHEHEDNKSDVDQLLGKRQTLLPCAVV